MKSVTAENEAQAAVVCFLLHSSYFPWHLKLWIEVPVPRTGDGKDGPVHPRYVLNSSHKGFIQIIVFDMLQGGKDDW